MIELSVIMEAHVKVVLQIKDTDVFVLWSSSQPIAKKVLAKAFLFVTRIQARMISYQ